MDIDKYIDSAAKAASSGFISGFFIDKLAETVYVNIVDEEDRKSFIFALDDWVVFLLGVVAAIFNPVFGASFLISALVSSGYIPK